MKFNGRVVTDQYIMIKQITWLELDPPAVPYLGKYIQNPKIHAYVMVDWFSEGLLKSFINAKKYIEIYNGVFHDCN